MTREEWLEKMRDSVIAHVFAPAGVDVPASRISCGWPSRSALSATNRRLGECWKGKAADDGVAQVFVSPSVDDSVEAAGIVVHELCHAVLPEAKHNTAFKRLGLLVGLEGKPTYMSPGVELKDKLNGLVDDLGEYPHSRLNSEPGEKKQGTRLLKALCPNDGYTVRVTRRWLDIGYPQCPCGATMIDG